MKFIYLWLLMGICLLACKKSDQPKTQTQIPHVFPLGTTNGSAISKTIGAEGGSVGTPDGTLKITIPPGALSGPTTISVQPVTKTLPSVTGTVYRLQPGNVQFKKDIDISFRYTEQDTKGTSEDLLYLAYQDDEGYWHRMVQTAINKTAKQLSAKTKHFSDWGIERVFHIATTPDHVALTAGQTAKLEVYYDDLPENTSMIDALLSEIHTIPEKNIDGWFVNGPGTLPETKKAVNKYQAPASIVAPQTIAAGVRIKGLVSKTHPERPGTGGLVIIQEPIDLVPDEYFIWEIGGTTNTAVALDGALLGTTTNIIGTGLTGGVALTLNATKPGSYDLGNAAAQEMFNLQVSRSNQSTVIYQGTYFNCGDQTPHYGKGKLIISAYGSIGGFIEGTFSATVYANGSGCQNESKLVTGKFKIRRKA